MKQNKITILIVDDNPDVRTNVIKAIRVDNYTFLQAEDGQVMRNVLQSKLVDIVILDLRMPAIGADPRFLNFTGLEWLRFIKNTYPDIPVIIFSAVPGKAYQDDAYQLGAFSFIEKSEDGSAGNRLRDSVREAVFLHYGIHPTSTESEMDLMQLKNIISQVFNLDEFQDLCMQLGISYDSLSGTNLNGKARELVNHFQRRQELPELIATCVLLRPNSPWPQG